MKLPRRPLFLDPDHYRQRRLVDAARLLPVLGGFLFFLPVLWLPGTTGHSTAVEGVYLFVVWALLIGVARLFAPGLSGGGDGAEQPPEPPDSPEAVPAPAAPNRRGVDG